MATLTIRKLDDEVKRRLRIRTAEHGRSMEEEARAILSDALELSGESLAQAIRKRFALLGGVELELPSRGPSHRELPRFDLPDYDTPSTKEDGERNGDFDDSQA